MNEVIPAIYALSQASLLTVCVMLTNRKKKNEFFMNLFFFLFVFILGYIGIRLSY